MGDRGQKPNLERHHEVLAWLQEHPGARLSDAAAAFDCDYNAIYYSLRYLQVIRDLDARGPRPAGKSVYVHPKQRAKQLIGRGVRNGSLRKPQRCSVCGQAGRIEGHHPDYSKPLKVKWLCTACHRKRHGHRARAKNA